MRWLIVFAALASSLVLAVTARADATRRDPVAPLGWAQPEALRILRWPGTGGRDVTGLPELRLESGELLLVPVRPGQRVRVSGPVTAIGLGQGDGAAPGTIVWHGDELVTSRAGDAREIYVPIWSDAKVLALGASPGGVLRVDVARAELDPMRWDRADERIAAWLDGAPDASLPEPPAPDAASILRWIGASRRVAVSAGADPNLVAAWLGIRWLDEAARVRTLAWPHFVRQSVAVGGGRSVHMLAQIEDATAWRSVRGGERVVFRGDVDVVRIALSAKRRTGGAILVREGERIARVIQWGRPLVAPNEDSWTEPQWIRVVLPASRSEASIEVVAGEVAAAAIGYTQQTSLLDVFARKRDRAALAARALARPPRAAFDRALVALIRAESEPTSKNLAELSNLSSSAEAGDGIARALIEAESARLASTPEAARVAGARSLERLRDAPAADAGPIGRRVLEHLRDTVLGAPPASPLAAVDAVDVDDRDAIAADLAILGGPHGARRALVEEAYARAHGELATAALRAHQTWLRETAWEPLRSDVPLRFVPRIPEDAPGDPFCNARGAHGLRWSLLGPGATSVVVSKGEGSHARVVLRGGFADDDEDLAVKIDGVPIAVHAAAGLPSFVAVTPGARTFERPAGSSVLVARIPRDDRGLCRDLREIDRWARIERQATFTLPPSIASRTVAEIVLAPAEGAGTVPPRVTVHAGSASYEAWISGDARIEVPVTAGSRTIEVEVDRAVDARAYVRGHGVAPSVAPHPAQAPSGDVEASLARVRAATRALRAGPPPDDAQLRAERAAALDALGYHRLALVDLPDAPEPSADDAIAPAESVNLPADRGAVEPLGFVARVPPLARGDGALLRDARDLHDRGDFAGVTVALQDAHAGDAATLLLAVDAERAKMPATAQAALEKLAFAHDGGVPLAHAAVLGADASLAASDRARALRAFVLAQIAADHGDPADGAFGRLAPAIAWARPSRPDSARGFALVASGEKQPTPLASRVRRAWSDAPDDAAVLAEGHHLEASLTRPGASSIVVRSRCEAFDRAPCALDVLLDGTKARCAAPGSGERVCRVGLPAGQHRVEVRGPAERDVIGWASIEQGEDKPVVPLRAVSEWFEIDKDAPFELAFAAPTVVRVEARSAPGDAREITADVVTRDGTSTATLALPPDVDADAGRIVARGAPEAPVTVLAERSVPVLTAGPATLRVRAPARAFVRVSVAWASGLPRPATRDASVAATLPQAVVEDDRLPEPAPRVVDDPIGFVASVTGYTRLIAKDVELAGDDEAVRDLGRAAFTPYVEMGATLRRELVEQRLWAAASAFGRFRVGPTSAGVQGWVDLQSGRIAPGLAVNALGIEQSAASGETLYGGHASASVYHQIPLTGTLRFVPTVSYTVQPVDRALRFTTGADTDVYTPYAYTHPRYASASAQIAYRPLSDTMGRFEIAARTMPEFDAIDRVEGRFGLDTVTGAGAMPWLSFRWTVSYRPLTERRLQAFVRDTVSIHATIWTWMFAGHRLSFDATAQAVFDVPNNKEGQPPFSGGMGVTYDYTGVRGLRDFPPRMIPYRDRMEEGSGRVRRVEPPPEPTWSSPP